MHYIFNPACVNNWFVCNLLGVSFSLHPCGNTCWQQWRSKCSWWWSPSGCQEGRRQLQTRVHDRNRHVKVCVAFSCCLKYSSVQNEILSEFTTRGQVDTCRDQIIDNKRLPIETLPLKRINGSLYLFCQLHVSNISNITDPECFTS